MSSEEQKFSHSKRLQKDENAVKKQINIAKTYDVPFTEPHKFAKHHVMNCGNPKCHMCANPRKVFNELTQQEKRLFQEKLQDNYTPNYNKMLDN